MVASVVVMSDVDVLQAQVQDALSRAALWELTARRATAGAQSSSKGAERLYYRCERLRDTIKLLKAKIEGLERVNREQEKKISRLSLELLGTLSTPKDK